MRHSGSLALLCSAQLRCTGFPHFLISLVSMLSTISMSLSLLARGATSARRQHGMARHAWPHRLQPPHSRSGSAARSSAPSSCPVWSCPVDSDASSLSSLLAPAVSCLRRAEVVAMPTETVYGLAGDACSDAAMRRIFAAKGRPSDNPLIVHCQSARMVLRLCHPMTPSQHVLTQAFWPGPLTLLLTARADSGLSLLATAGQPYVAVRVPAHPIAQALLSLTGLPLAAPSANLSGRPSPTTASHVLHDLGSGRGVSGIVDSGQCGVGLESTVVRCTEQAGDDGAVRPRIEILRPGAVTQEHLRQLLPHAIMDVSASQSPDHRPLAPGMKYGHYKPTASVVLLNGSYDWRHRCVLQRLMERKRVGLMSTSEEGPLWTEMQAQVTGMGAELHVLVMREGADGVAHDLFACLRALDERQVDIVFVTVLGPQGLGEAVMDRLCKAAEGELWVEPCSSLNAE